MKIDAISFKSSPLSHNNRTYSSNSNYLKAEENKPQSFNKSKTIKTVSIIAGSAVGLIALCNIKNIAKIFSKKFESAFPEYLYHITSEDNYNKILQDGLLKTSKIENSVFLFDIKNLMNQAQESNLPSIIKWSAGTHFQDNAPRFTNQKVVTLKIAVKDLNKNALTFQSIGPINWAGDTIPRQSMDNLSKEEFQSWKDYPLEYLHAENIPISKIKLVNTVDVAQLDENKLATQFFRTMFSNTPEQNTIYEKFPDQ